MSKDRGTAPVLHELANLTLFAIGITCCVIGLVILISENKEHFISTILLGSFLILAGTIDRFKSLEAFGVKATVKDLRETLDEAHETLERLKELTATSGASSVILLANIGRGVPPPPPEVSHYFAARIKKTLESTEAKHTVIKDALYPWVNNNIRDLSWFLVQKTRSEMDEIYTPIHSYLMNPPLNTTSLYDPNIREKEAEMLKHYEVLRDYEDWPHEEVIDRVIAFISGAPRISETIKNEGKSLAETWRSEVNFLIEKSDFRTPSRWYSVLSERRNGSPNSYTNSIPTKW